MADAPWSLTRFLVGWGESFIMKCIISSSENSDFNPKSNRIQHV